MMTWIIIYQMQIMGLDLYVFVTKLDIVKLIDKLNISKPLGPGGIHAKVGLPLLYQKLPSLIRVLLVMVE